MQQLLTWTLRAIREEDSCFSWIEEYRFEWVPLVKSAIEALLEGKTMLLLCDERHRWFGAYVLAHINDVKNERPFLPVYPLGKCFPELDRVKKTEELELLEDMLEISYPAGYFFWYIGKESHPYSKIAFRNDESFLWLSDVRMQNAFTIKSDDPLADVKLLQLYRLFDKTLTAALFGDLDLER